ncbi:MAG: hypothetical protein RRY22_04160, partial [Bacilli bacterium]
KKKVGRPAVVIDQKQFENLCGLFCTLDEIAGWFNCSPDTIQNWCKKEYGEIYSAVYKKHNSKGKISLRRCQFKLAERNSGMAIFLGKQYLNQKDFIINDDDLKKIDEYRASVRKLAKTQESELND